MLSSAFGGNVENSLSVVVVAVADFGPLTETLDPLSYMRIVGFEVVGLDKYSINRCNLLR